MPSISKRQRRFMGAELGRMQAGKATHTGMNEGQLKDFASTKEIGLPLKKKLAQRKMGGHSGMSGM